MAFAKTITSRKDFLPVALSYLCLSVWANSFHSLGRTYNDTMSDGMVGEFGLGVAVMCMAHTAGLALGCVLAYLLNRRDMLGKQRTLFCLFLVMALSHVGYFIAFYLGKSYYLSSLCHLFAFTAATIVIIFLLVAAAQENQKRFLVMVLCGVPGSVILDSFIFLPNIDGVAAFAESIIGAAFLMVAFAFCRNLKLGSPDSVDVANSDGVEAVKANRYTRATPTPLLVHFVAYGVGFGMLHMSMSSKGPWGRGMLFAIATCVGAGVSILILYLLFKRPLKTGLLWQQIRGVVFPVVLVGFSLYLLPVLEYIPIALVEGAGLYYEVIVLMGCFLAARETRLNPLAIFAGGLGMYGFGFLLGSFVGTYLASQRVMSDQSYSLIPLLIIIIVMFALGTFWVGDEDALRKW